MILDESKEINNKQYLQVYLLGPPTISILVQKKNMNK